MHFTYGYKFFSHSLSGCPLNAQAIKKVKVSEGLMTIKLKATGGKSPSPPRSRLPKHTLCARTKGFPQG